MKKTIRKVILSFLTVSVLLAGCKSALDGCQTQMGLATSAEIAALQSYLSAHSITAAQDPRGFFYQVVNPGAGVTASASSLITIRYTGSLLDGTVFDSNTSAGGIAYQLDQLIIGWQRGIPLIKKGGIINLYLPASLGYGCSTIGSIPANSALIFNIELLDVQ